MLANKRFGVLVDKLYKAGIYIPPASPDTWAVRRLVRNICDMLSLTFRVRSTSSSAVPFLSSWIFQPSLRILFLLVLFTSVISDVHSTTDDQKCNATVVSLPVSNVTLSSGSQMRGIYAQIGTPPQKISMLPNLLVQSAAFMESCN